MLRLERVSRIYSRNTNAVPALDQLSFTLETGDFAAVTGPSGCGKSTLLNLLGGLDRPDSGQIWIEKFALHKASERQLTRYRRRDLGIVFQFFNLLPGMTLAENVELPLLLRGDSARKSRPRVREMLDLVGLDHRRSHFPHQLSGGEMQRTAIARALAGAPRLLLADEPTGNLDTANANRVAETLLDIANQRVVTLVVVTHSEELAGLASHHLRMRDGRLVPE